MDDMILRTHLAALNMLAGDLAVLLAIHKPGQHESFPKVQNFSITPWCWDYSISNESNPSMLSNRTPVNSKVKHMSHSWVLQVYGWEHNTATPSPSQHYRIQSPAQYGSTLIWDIFTLFLSKGSKWSHNVHLYILLQWTIHTIHCLPFIYWLYALSFIQLF